jgi:dipeptidyl aminopeptidase/acylaminoacyl peptidase
MIDSAAVKTLTAETLFKLTFLNGAVLSPDGTQVLYVLSYVNGDQDQYAIWWHSLQTGETRQMSADGHSPAWSPNGQAFAFISGRNDRPQIFLMPVNGGEARQLTTVKQGVGGGPAWSPDGKTIAFSAGPAFDEPFDFSKPYRITRAVYRIDGAGYLDQAVQNIYLISSDGGEAQQLTDDRTMNINPIWSPSGREILYMESMRPDSFEATMPVLRVLDLAGNSRALLGDWGYANYANWTANGQRIVFVGEPKGVPAGSKKDVFVIGREGGLPENRSANLNYDPGGLLMPDLPNVGLIFDRHIFCDDDSAWLPVQRGGTLQIWRVALQGDERHEAIVSGQRACLLQDLAQGRLLYATSTLNDPAQLCVADLKGANEQVLTRLNHDILAAYTPPQIDPLQFKGTDGVDVEGWYFRPPLLAAPYPTILYIHGGPHMGWGHVYNFDFQMLAAAGYGVLVINHRGSTGYGNAFATATKGDWGNLDYQDLMAGVDHAIAQGLADPDRLGVCGLSGGGNLTCWTIGHTDRFKAAVPENPVTNFVSFYGVSDIGVRFAVSELGGHPHEIPEVYARCSPITYAHRCTTPTLLLQSEQDYRCPADQAEQFYTVLKANGCMVEMLRLPNSAHVGSIAGPVASRRAQNEAMLDWFHRFIPVGE